jgi:hypothetical protein
MNNLKPKALLEVAKVLQGTFCVEQLSKRRFHIPIYKSSTCFRLNTDRAFSILVPTNIMILSKETASVSALFDNTLNCRAAYIYGYCDSPMFYDEVKLTADINVCYMNTQHSLSCRVIRSQYNEFYRQLTVSTRVHYTLAIKNITSAFVPETKARSVDPIVLENHIKKRRTE